MPLDAPRAYDWLCGVRATPNCPASRSYGQWEVVAVLGLWLREGRLIGPRDRPRHRDWGPAEAAVAARLLSAVQLGRMLGNATISDALAKEAAAEGLLETGSIEALLRERLAAARVAKMQATRQKLSATGTPPMTAEEIEAEIQAYRAERRRAAGA